MFIYWRFELDIRISDTMEVNDKEQQETWLKDQKITTLNLDTDALSSTFFLNPKFIEAILSDVSTYVL